MLQRTDDADLLLWIDPGIDVRPQHRILQRVVGEGRQVPARDHGRLVVADSYARRDVVGGIRVVAGDHHRDDAGRPAILDRSLRFRPGRIREADQAQEAEIPLHRGRCDGRQGGEVPTGERKHTIALCCERSSVLE